MPRVYVIWREGRPFLELQWRDALTGKLKTRSTKTKDRRKAERLAATLEDQLTRGDVAAGEITWNELTERYFASALSGLAVATQQKARTTWKLFAECCGVRNVRAITAAHLEQFASFIRKRNCSEVTLKNHLTEMLRLLTWAHKRKLVDTVPEVDLPKRTSGMKGRAITGEEFDRMKSKVATVVGAEAAPSWLWLLDGLYWSGLRISEALALRWDSDDGWTVDTAGKHWTIRVRSHSEKGRRDRTLPIAPEFVAMLRSVPASQRRGRVFRPHPLKADCGITDTWVGKIISRIGEAAGVRVSSRKHARQSGNSGKFASAHDLRRAFGFRWAHRVPVATLCELMRHKSVLTTMQYYVGVNAEATADRIHDAAATNDPTNTAPFAAFEPSPKPQ